jgi:hypothetical protein
MGRYVVIMGFAFAWPVDQTIASLSALSFLPAPGAGQWWAVGSFPAVAPRLGLV